MENKSLKQIIDNRLEKLKKIRELGIEPYAYDYDSSHHTSEINEKLIDSKVSLAGRVMSLRKMGKASFANIQDQEGRIQFYIARDDVGEDNYNLFKLTDIGDFVGIEGKVFKTKTDALTIKVSHLTILSKNIKPIPDVKEKDGEKYNLVSDKEFRYITKSTFPELINCSALCESLSYSKKFPVNFILDGNPDIHPRVCEKLTSPSFPANDKQAALIVLLRVTTYAEILYIISSHSLK